MGAANAFKTNYYDQMAKAKEVRPFAITEDLEWTLMTWFHQILWWMGTLLQIVSLTIFSLRIDRLAQWKNSAPLSVGNSMFRLPGKSRP